MATVSIIIIAKNEAENIVACINSAQQISNDIIVADSGSTDGTQQLAKAAGANVIATTWQGYGQTRNNAAMVATSNWVFAMDADERITPELAETINQLVFTNNSVVYGCKRKSFLAGQAIDYGEWGRDKVFRLYHKKNAFWNLNLVHENVVGTNICKKIIEGELLHYTIKDLAEYEAKTILYAKLSAQKYFDTGKSATFIKCFLSPCFSFVQNYIFRLGFLDGNAGFIIAKTSAKYIYLKYYFLKKMYFNHN